MGRKATTWGGVAAGAMLLIALVLLWRWVLDQPEDLRISYMQTAAVIFPGAAAVAAFGSLGAALAARSAAKASADTARQARDALAFHFRPEGTWTTWRKFDREGNEGSLPLIANVDISTLRDGAVTALFHFRAPEQVENIRFWYTCADSPEQGPLRVHPGELMILPADVIGLPKDRTLPSWESMHAPTNLRRWRLRCFQPDGLETWEAAGTVPTEQRGMTPIMMPLDFQVVRE